MSNKDKFINYMNSLDETKRIKEITDCFTSDTEIGNIFREMEVKQQQLVKAINAKQEEQAEIYKKEYNELLEKVKNLPLLDEFVELSAIATDKLGEASYLLEDVIDDVIKHQ